MSPSRPNTGVATAADSNVAVIAHDALDALVCNKFGNTGINGTINVCINATLMPAAGQHRDQYGGVSRGSGRRRRGGLLTTHPPNVH